MKKGIMAVFITAIIMVLAGISSAGTIALEEIKAITAESSENINSGKVVKVLLQPGELFLKRTKGWIIAPASVERNKENKGIMGSKNADRILVEYEKERPPQPSFKIEYLKEYAQVGKPNYVFAKAYVAQTPDDSAEYFAILASKKEIFLNKKNKQVYFFNVEKLDIKLSPALFFSYGEDKDKGKYVNILVVDEDEVKNLHTGSVKTAVFRFYPSNMTVVAKGDIGNSEKKLYEWKGKREDD